MQDGTLFAGHLVTSTQSLLWFLWKEGRRYLFFCVRAPACVRELCPCRLPLFIGQPCKRGGKSFFEGHATRKAKSTWRFLLLQAAHHTHMNEGITLAHFLLFPPPLSKHLQQYTPVITLDIFGFIHICLSAKISHQIYQSITKT